MDRFTEMYQLQKLTQEEKENQNRALTSEEIGLVRQETNKTKQNTTKKSQWFCRRRLLRGAICLFLISSDGLCYPSVLAAGVTIDTVLLFFKERFIAKAQSVSH